MRGESYWDWYSREDSKTKWDPIGYRMVDANEESIICEADQRCHDEIFAHRARELEEEQRWFSEVLVHRASEQEEPR